MPIQLGGPSLPLKPLPKKQKLPYNPWAYVPGGSSPAVAQAIQTKGFKPLTPIAPAVPAAPAAPAGPSGLDLYKGELSGDEMWQVAERNYKDALAMGERAQFGDPFRAALVQYGLAPSEADLSGLGPAAAEMARRYLDPTAVAAASANPYSTTKQIARGFDQALAGMGGEWASRGTLGSGGMNIAQSNYNYERGLQDKQALDQFLSQIGGFNRNWINFQTEQQARLREAQEAVATRRSQEAGYNALLDAFGNVVAEPQQDAAAVAAAQDYSGGPNAIYQPSPATQKVIQKMKAQGSFSAWEKAMAQMGSASPATAINKPAKKMVI